MAFSFGVTRATPAKIKQFVLCQKEPWVTLKTEYYHKLAPISCAFYRSTKFL